MRTQRPPTAIDAPPGQQACVLQVSPRKKGALRTLEPIAAAVTLSALLFAPAYLCFSGDGVQDPDVWWHLRTGEWIVEQGEIPESDAFSNYAAGRPLVAYSWLMDVTLYGLYRAVGLRGVILYSATLSVAITAALYALMRHMQPGLLRSAP